LRFRAEEAAFTFSGVIREAPFQKTFLEGYMDDVRGFQWIRGGGLNGKIISIE